MKRELREIHDRDIQGMPVYSSDGELVGQVNCQVSDLAFYTHRYLIVEHSALRLAIPADAIENITQERITLNLQSNLLEFLPPYDAKLGRAFELRVHLALNRTPYWENDINE